MNALRQWFNGLASRERRLVYVAAALAAVALLYAVIVLPLNYLHSRQVARIAQKQEDLAWMRQAAPRVAAMAVRGGAAGNESLVVLVDRTSRSSGLGGAVRDQSPTGDRELKLRLEGASFDSMIAWLALLDQQFGVGVAAATIDRAGAPGLVNATLTLTHGAPAAR